VNMLGNAWDGMPLMAHSWAACAGMVNLPGDTWLSDMGSTSASVRTRPAPSYKSRCQPLSGERLAFE
jgi:hypothetical protein